MFHFKVLSKGQQYIYCHYTLYAADCWQTCGSLHCLSARLHPTENIWTCYTFSVPKHILKRVDASSIAATLNIQPH